MNGLAWATPAAFAALAALAVPILLHLAARAHREGHAFPSLMFVRRVPFRRRRRTRLRDPLLFVLRCLALAALVAAFAGPLTTLDPDAVAAAGRQDVVVVLDRSASMAVAGRFAAARALVEAELNALGPDQRVALIAYADRPAVMSGFDAGVAGALSALRALQPGSGGTRSVSALRAAGALLASEGRGRARVLLVSDLQRAGFARQARLSLPAGTTVTVRGVPSQATAAVRIAGVRARAGAGARVQLDVEVVRQGSAWPPDIAVSIEAEGRRIATLPLAPGQAPRTSVATMVVQAPDRDIGLRLWVTGGPAAESAAAVRLDHSESQPSPGAGGW